VPDGLHRVDTGARPGEWPHGVPEHVTRPLLDRIIEQSLDEDYRQVALRKAGGPDPPPPGRPRVVAALMVAAFGVLVTTAAVQTSANADVVDASRTTLIGRITDEREQAERQQKRIASLQDDTIALEDELDDLTADLQSATAEQRRLEVRTGYVAVTGGGLRVTVNDNPDGDVSQLVRDEDLALLVDGLWGAGAEAIAINDRRLTPLTGIHNRGIAIEVGDRPVNPPYIVAAIGDVDTLAADLLDTTHGEQFFELATGLGFPHSLQNVDEMTLPGARGPVLRYVGRGTAGKPGMDDKEGPP
jgi:uncharacterized protein YlxW (UPF0749 family)